MSAVDFMLLPASHLFDYPCSAPVASTSDHQTKQPLKRHVSSLWDSSAYNIKQHTSSCHKTIEVSSLAIIEPAFHGFPKAHDIRTTPEATGPAGLPTLRPSCLEIWRTEVQRVVQQWQRVKLSDCLCAAPNSPIMDISGT